MVEDQKVESAEPQKQEQEKGMVSRRKLLASLGMAGVALASSGLINGSLMKAYAEPADSRLKVKDLMNMDLVTTTTIAELRANTQPAAERAYFVKNIGMEGMFYYDAADTSTQDNTGTVLVSTSGARFKRIFDGPVHVKWFGTKGNGYTDDTALIQKALAYCTANKVNLFFASGTYIISASLSVTSISLLGSPGTVIKKGGNHDAFFVFCICEGENVSIHNMIFDGNRDSIQSHWTDDGSQFGFKTVNIAKRSIAVKSYAYHTLVDNCLFRNIHGDGFYGEKPSHTIFVRESRFENIAQNAIWTWDCENLHVHDSHFHNIGILPEQFYVNGTLTSFAGAVKWNHEYGDGVYCFANKATVANNSFLNINRIAIVGEQFTDKEPEITVTGNVIEHNHARLRCNNPCSSIWMEQVKKATITGNTTRLIQRDMDELIVTDITLSINHFEHSEYTVTGNVIDSSNFNREHATSIAVWTSPGVSCTIEGNIIRSKSDQAILIGNTKANNFIISNNDITNFNANQSSCIKFIQAGEGSFCKNLIIKDNNLKQISNPAEGNFYCVTFAHGLANLTDSSVVISGNDFNERSFYINQTFVSALAIEANRNMDKILMAGTNGSNRLIIHDNYVNRIELGLSGGSNNNVHITNNYCQSIYMKRIFNIFIQNNTIRTTTIGIHLDNTTFQNNLIRVIGNTIDLLDTSAKGIFLDSLSVWDLKRAFVCQNVLIGNGMESTVGITWTSNGPEYEDGTTPIFEGNIYDERLAADVVKG